MRPIVAIVGRPNVGKSTLFNRLVGRPMAIVTEIAGTTRDRIFADVTWDERNITIVDTGGLEAEPETAIARKVRSQVEMAIEESDVIIFLLDAGEGLLPADIEIADKLRRLSKPVVTVVNKVDGERQEGSVPDFYRLGAANVIGISAYHNRNIPALKEAVLPLLPPVAPEPPAKPGSGPRVALVGRPGVGKSTILNALAGKERAIVNDVPGTTRDTLDTVIDFGTSSLHVIDTGGIKQRGRIGTGIAYYSLLRALRAIELCDVAVLVIDAGEVITAQDTHVAQYIMEAEKGIVVVVNKTDLIPKGERPAYEWTIAEHLKFMPYAPILYTSATIGKGIVKILPAALEVWQERTRRLPDEAVNATIKEAVAAHLPPHKGLKRINVYGGYQVDTSPPAFVILVNEPNMVHFSYKRYLDNRLRQAFGFSGTPLRITFKKKSKRAGKGASR